MPSVGLFKQITDKENTNRYKKINTNREIIQWKHNPLQPS